MLEHRPLAEIAGIQTDWLTAKHHFALGSYGNPAHRPIGDLYVWNDDEISPHGGFPLHGHADVEIVTYVREGAITHVDDLGNQGVTRAGDVQVMSAGTGIRHAEHNDEDVTTRIFQIWLHPRQRGGAPQWGAKPFPKADRSGRLVLLASGNGTSDGLPIRADADIYGALLTAGETISYRFDEGYDGYLVPAAGAAIVDGIRIEAREGLAIRNEPTVTIHAASDAELVFVVTRTQPYRHGQ
jgi:redox-sensitive bicupin YhaK (pirin superfamily)